MRITVGMKCPDALERAIEEAAEGEVDFKGTVEKAKAVAAKCFIRVTVDTDAETCIVESN